MKAWAWMAVIPIVGSLAQAESLGEAARRERERREKKRAAAPAPVIRDEELTAAPGKASRGTFNPAAGSAATPANTSAAPRSSPSPGNGGGTSEVDRRRSAARERLDASYEFIRDTAASLAQAILQYGPCEGVFPVTTSCQARERHIGTLVVSIAIRMEQAEDAARQGWLTPGDVRDARQRYGMSDAFWDELVRIVHQRRR